jgi:glycosyltransferase involved in cell wall biosynthesis
MAMGVPVLAANTRIHQRYFKDDIVEFFESDDIEDLAAKIFALMQDPARRDALRERARGFILENNWDVKKQEYLDLVDCLVKRQAPLRTVVDDRVHKGSSSHGIEGA